MARIARVVIPGVPHHVTQRGNRRLPTFFAEGDYAAYKEYLTQGCTQTGTEVWAYCLMPNHVHLLLVPKTADGLRAALAEAHRRYTRMINFRNGWRGHLWQERFASFPMDEAHLLNAARYVELNPVRAGLVATAGEYPWSSAQSHLHNTPDPLVNVHALLDREPNWSAFLERPSDPHVGDHLHRHENTGRPFGDQNFMAKIEAVTGKSFTLGKPGRPTRR